MMSNCKLSHFLGNYQSNLFILHYDYQHDSHSTKEYINIETKSNYLNDICMCRMVNNSLNEIFSSFTFCLRRNSSVIIFHFAVRLIQKLNNIFFLNKNDLKHA